MDQVKIGNMLKELRKEKGLTQEELAEHFGVSNRTVSRWETGSNMPDLSLLVELSDFYDTDIRDIINGERKSEKMNEELKDTLQKAAEYADGEKEVLFNRVRGITIMGVFAFALAMILESRAPELPVFDMLSGIMFGMTGGALIVCLLYTTGVLEKMKKNGHMKGKILIIVLCAAICIIAFAAALYKSI
ncbi:MAG: helix-turn-helix domain-containing protein [Lachnospiraceae bacterium]|nr:helix-turn-helix domain-containing protein [Lachnospiraceae bacterium]